MDVAKPERFDDRTAAGRLLAVDLQRFLHGHEAVVLAIPMGGVPVAAAVSSALSLPLDLMVSRRIPAPAGASAGGEDSLGAVTPDRTLVVNGELAASIGIDSHEVERLSIPVWSDAQRRLQYYRKGRPDADLRGKTAIVIDDGLTTGYTMMAAVIATRKLEPARIIVAVPVAAIESIERLGSFADEILSLKISAADPFSVADYYNYYSTLTDNDVLWTLDHFWNEHPLQGFSETF